jgi:hypothetical protein
MVHKLLADWRIRAIESGYIQEIEEGNLEALFTDGQRTGASFEPRVVQPVHSNLVPGHVQAAESTPLAALRKFADTAPHTALIPLSEHSPASFVGRSV